MYRAEGFGTDVLEVWSIGYPGQEEAIATLLADLPEGFSEVLLADVTDPEASVWASWGANVNDLFVVDPEGMIVYETNVAVAPLTVTENLAALDAVIRGLLE